MDKIRILMVTIMGMAIFISAAIYNNSKQRILVVHSYSENATWVKDVNLGLASSLAKSQQAIQVRYYYLQLDGPNVNCKAIQAAAANAYNAINDFRPDVIITVDDLSQQVVGSTYADYDSPLSQQDIYEQIAWRIAHNYKCPGQGPASFSIGKKASIKTPTIIFAGVNGDIEPYYGSPRPLNVSGIYEWKNFPAIEQAISDIYLKLPANQRPAYVQVLSDTSATAEAEKGRMEQLMSQNLNVALQWKEIKVIETFEEWKQAIADANATGTMLFIANYGEITDPNIKKADMPKKLIEYAEKESRYPVIGASTGFVQQGGMLTIAVPGFEQGQVAMKLALMALSNKELPNPQTPEQFVIGMNQNLVDARNLKLPLLYKALSQSAQMYIPNNNSATK